VKVRVVLDKSQRSERYTSATYLSNHQVPTWIDDKHAIAHNKIILIDRATIFTGSFNFTKAAEQKNAENLLIIEGHPELVRDYQANFDEHLGHAEKYEGLSAKETIAPTADDEGGDQKPQPKALSKPAARRTRKAA
jgi:phosphatidylserine/phosphatidylglycerophosphate/cardiolipin synthase-like enzyme